MPTRLEIATEEIVRAIESTGKRVFSRRDLSRILSANRETWHPAQGTTVNDFIEFLLEHGLTQHVLRSDLYKPITRYCWGEVSSLLLGVSLRPDSYLSHGTAVFLHGLTDQVPAVVYVNQEQSAKPQMPRSSLTQQALDRAFKSRQRQSAFIYKERRSRYVLLSGKQTNRLEVGHLKTPTGEDVDGTNLERTLIDIVVRPTYAGGVYEVLRAFESARDLVSTTLLLGTLRKLDYVYPYHQAIGLYMERAGFPSSDLDLVSSLGIDLNFYLAHGVDTSAFDSRWKLFLPQGF